MKNTFIQLFKIRKTFLLKTVLTFLFLVLCKINSNAGVVVTIPSTPGTDTSSFTPTNRRTTYSAARMLFNSTEIGTTGTITHLAFQKASGSTATSVNYISIYMKETTSSTLTTTVPSGFPTGYTRVYNSSYIDNTMASGWTTITLSTAVGEIMTYSGGSNYLDIVVVKTNAETATSSFPVYNCHATSGPISAYYFGSSILGTTFTTTTTKRPNVQLTIENTCAGKPAAGTISGPSTAVCSAASFTLTGTGLTLGTGMKYQWQSRSFGFGPYVNTSASDTFTTFTTSTTSNKDYRVYSVCTLSGQSDTSAPITVNVVNASTVSALSDTTFCIGASVTLNTTTTSGITYTWFNGATNTGITGSTYVATTSGTYSVRASTTSCAGVFSNTKTVTVNVLPPSTVTPLSSTTFCDGLSVVLQASTGTGLTYQWQKGAVDIFGATSSSYTATAAGSYRVKVTNSTTGCNVFSSATTVTVNPMPLKPVIGGAGGATSYCASDNLVLSTIPTSGISYQWKNLSGSIAGATTNTYTAYSPSTYTLTATLGSCSIDSDPLVITENPLPAASITPSGTVSFCNGDSLRVDATTSTGVTYQWLESGTPISGLTTSSVYLKTAGVYSVKVVNSTTGCSDQSSALTINIISPSLPTISAAGPTTFCTGGSVTLNATIGAGLLAQWQRGGTDMAGETAVSLVANNTGDYRMKVTNGVGCAAYSSVISVLVNPLPDNSTTVTGGTDICNGDVSVILAAVKPGYTYQWRNLSIDIPGETGNPYYAKTAGTYSVHITDSNGCQDNSSDVVVTVKFVSPFYIHPYGNTFFCDGEKTKLATQSGFTSYQWYLNGVFIPGATDTFVYADKNGKYSVQVQDPLNGCYATSTGFNIVVIPSPDTPFITKTGTRLSTSVKGVFYQWYKDGVAIPGAIDSFIMTTGTGGIYKIVVTNTRDCSKSAEIDLNPSGIEEGSSTTYYVKVYPNPTQDKLNVEAPKGITVSLLDMQGRVLFQHSDTRQIDMTQFASGVYIIQFADTDGQVIATEKVSKIDY
ncbi:MAG: T9SS type A sorting domain-containing protein [Bacteroidota bacterium]